IRAEHAKTLRSHFERRSVDPEKTFAHGRLPMVRTLLSKERAKCGRLVGAGQPDGPGGKDLPTGGKVPPPAEMAEIAPFLRGRRKWNECYPVARSGIGGSGHPGDPAGDAAAMRVGRYAHGAGSVGAALCAPVRSRARARRTGDPG